ncbi:hypothetical protein KDA11_05355, partial [Candidatus Saccharibacteria bacterium]|nr:hypothetical protein [Candidatus Saccharibacteria bacterium]
MAFLGSATRSRQKGFQKQKSFKDFFKTGNRKTIAIIIVIALASIGAYLLFFASAATNNCQVENNVQICDVDQTAGSADTVLSLYGEAESLANSGWGIYYGAAFRAPTSAYNGAVPVHRLNNGNASWHEWVTDAQKGQKEAAAGGAGNLVHEGVAFFAWTDASQPGTVPIYRITRGGTDTQSIFTTDKAWVDKMLVGGEWKADETMPLIAFYAYPANYAVAETPNPYDCSIQVNYESDRCASQKQNLEKGVSQGVITASTECPKSWSDWNKNVNPGQFAKECQDIWNTYGKDCSNSEILATDRCKKEREALEAANKAAIKARDDVAKAAKAAKIASNVKAPSDRTASGSNTSASNSCPASVEAWNALGAAGQKQTAKDCQKFWNTVSGKICPSG